MARYGLAKVDGEESRTHTLREPDSQQPPASDPWQTTVFDLFRNAACRNSQAIAISDTSDSITYAELWNFAAAFHARLVAQGVGPGDRVGVAASRSITTFAAILGVVIAGGCYVPIDVEDLPAQILTKLTEQSGLHHWIADADALRSVNSVVFVGHSVLRLEDVRRPGGEVLAEIPVPAIDADSPIYVMFTSGSTGLPKGVVVPHRAVARLVMGQTFLQFGPKQTFLLHSPLSFDASTLELWGSLLHGGRLIVAPARQLGLDDYTNLLIQQKVTTLWLTAAVFHLAAERAPEMFAPLSQLIFGGDVIAPRHVERIRTLYPALHMVNGYGPTENTTFTCCYVVPEDYRANGSLPIGRPIAGTTIRILNANFKDVAVGEEGELAAGGAGVALDYLGQPAATAEHFIPDIACDKKDAMLYRTGDRVRQRQDGVVEFLGRLDSQVKIAGHRVELNAVERAISNSPLVAEAAVVVLTPFSGEKQLAACVSLSGVAQDAKAQLHDWLRERLPRASIPQHWIFLEQLPINANGKLDRNALRVRCEAAFLFQDIQKTAPLSDVVGQEALDLSQTERYLQQLWASLLNRSSVGINDSFFDLGGTSLLLIEMHARLKTRFLSTPTVVDMFALPTPRALAERLHSNGELPRKSSAAEERGQRQRAAMLVRRMPSRIVAPAEERSR